MYKQILLLAILSTIHFQLSTCFAQSTVFTYQGRVTDNGTNFNGSGQFKFALVTSTNANHTATATAHPPSDGSITGYDVQDGGNGYVTAPNVTISGGGGSGATAHATISGGAVNAIIRDGFGSGYTSAPTVTIDPPPVNIAYTTYWSNDGTSADGSEPTDAVNVSVNNGLFTVTLGDTTIPGMAAIDASLFSQPDLQLRIWFNDGANGFAALDPAQNLTPAPYAANSVFANTASNVLGTIPVAQFSGIISSANLPNGLGGENNTASGGDATVSGGGNNTASNELATVSGGESNIAGGPFTTVGGGYGNVASNEFATVGGGESNTADSLGTVGGGESNTAGSFGTVGGGSLNTASGEGATASGGIGNTASGAGAFVGGGGWDGESAEGNTASGNASVIGGGMGNQATGDSATVPGGAANIAAGAWSFAAGINARATNDSAFVWADASVGKNNYIEPFYSTSVNSFNVRASGGVRFVTAIETDDDEGTPSAVVFLAPGGTSWSTISDQNAKKNFAPVNGETVLDKLAQVPVEQWNYKWEKDNTTPNIGPMAQAFKAAFYPGRDDKSITTLEFDGVELAAIQGLNQKLNEKDAEIAELKARLEKLERLMNHGGAK